MKNTISEQLMYSTIRLECLNREGAIKTGTGFFFNFTQPPYKGAYPVIITNKHVIKNAVKCELKLTKAINGEPLDNECISYVVNDFESRFIEHPNKDIDICVMPIGIILNELKQKNKEVFYIGLDSLIITRKDDLENLGAIEDTIMVGYPNGIWDENNNKPIFRKGITATHPKFDYEGRKEFLIDLSCFPGSSGSPVFIYNENGYVDKKNNSYNMEPRILFIGILRGGHEHIIQSMIDDEGNEIEVSMPNNLGVVIKSDVIIDLEKKFMSIVKGN